MKTLHPVLEALMPEPVGRIHHYAANHTPRIEWFRRPGNVGDTLFTADQVRAAILGATERAAKVCEDTDVVDVPGPNSYYCQLGDATATRDACAAAIRGTGGGA